MCLRYLIWMVEPEPGQNNLWPLVILQKMLEIFVPLSDNGSTTKMKVQCNSLFETLFHF